MSDTSNLIATSAERIFSDLVDKPLLDSTETGQFPDQIWAAIRENGFDQLGVADSGTDLADLFTVLRVVGRHAMPLPLAEACLANRWMGSSADFCSVGLVNDAYVENVPWGRVAETVVGVSDTGCVRLNTTQVDRGANLAGEARDHVTVSADAEALEIADNAFGLLALSRVAMMAGALETVLDLSLRYATEREQFGRSLSKFQVIQHHLAVMAAETAASLRSADAAIEALETPRFETELAVAKARIGEAVGVVNELAHQVHGAMGYTHEHQLHHFTRRLWAWRDEYGDEVYWQTRLGRTLSQQGGDGAWAYLATPR
jgi:acyl-CoA dehydrogenase